MAERRARGALRGWRHRSSCCCWPGSCPPRPSLAADPVADARPGPQPAHRRRPGRLPARRRARPSTASAGMWAGKFLDVRTGEILTVVSPCGRHHRVGRAARRGARAAQAARPVLERKADAPLLAAVRVRAAGRGAAGRGLARRRRLGGRGRGRAVASRGRVAGRSPHSHDASSRRARCGPSCGRRGARSMPRRPSGRGRRSRRSAAASRYVSTSAPLVFVDLPRDGGRRAGRAARGAQPRPRAGLANDMSSAGATVGANWTSGSGDQGNGVRVAVVEYHNAANTGDLAGQVVKRYSTNGHDRDPHPSDLGRGRHRQPEHHVARRRAGRRHRERRRPADSAPGLSTRPRHHRRRRLVGLAERRRRRHRQRQLRPGHRHRRRGGSPLLRLHRLGGRPAGRRRDRATSRPSDTGTSSLPGTGYNVLTVGGVNDRNTGGNGDDILWYAIERSELPSTPTARPGTRTATTTSRTCPPRRSACGRRTARSATGRASRARSWPASRAQLIARAPTLATWPEATRAILMAGAVRRTPLPGGGLSRDHEGVGTASARWSNRILDNGIVGRLDARHDDRGAGRRRATSRS